jgi:hypothetical protein
MKIGKPAGFTGQPLSFFGLPLGFSDFSIFQNLFFIPTKTSLVFVKIIRFSMVL